MPLSRRSFLASLIALPTGLVAAVKAASKKTNKFVWFVDWKDIEFPSKGTPANKTWMPRQTPKQRELFEAQQRYILCWGGKGSGKSKEEIDAWFGKFKSPLKT